jgi:predicted nucleic acid-binding protein
MIDGPMILDTDVLIDLVRQHPAAAAWFASLPTLPAVCGFAALELAYGCLNAAELRAVRTFLRAFTIVWPTEEDLSRALVEYAPLHLSHGLGAMDALIAATAVGRGTPLVTLNVRHFRAVPNLTTLPPYRR